MILSNRAFSNSTYTVAPKIIHTAVIFNLHLITIVQGRMVIEMYDFHQCSRYSV